MIKNLNTSEERIEEMTFEKEKIISKIEDLDYADAMIQLNTEEMKNTASLQTGARLIQPSLLNFLR